LAPSIGAIVMEMVDLWMPMVLHERPEVCELIQHRLQICLMERNGGSAQIGLEGLAAPFIAIL
jgi:hypothetical protein